MPRRTIRRSVRTDSSDPADALVVNVEVNIGREAQRRVDANAVAALRSIDFEDDGTGEPDEHDQANTDMPIDDGSRPQPISGLDPATGRYLSYPATARAVAAIARRRLAGHDPQADGQRGELIPGVEPNDLASAGWGIVFARGADPALREQLTPLIARRESQAGKLFKIFENRNGVRSGESATSWLRRTSKFAPGSPIDPSSIPFYLLLVGSPEDISFVFQLELATHFAVGRVAFDQLEDYGLYAIAAACEEYPARTPVASIFGPDNADDPATTYSRRYLVDPLVESLGQSPSGAWSVDAKVGTEADKATLQALISGRDYRPALVLTASHGLGYSSDPTPPGRLGALVCQDWPGPMAWQGPLPPDYSFAAEDVPLDADVAGLITFHFACYSAGVPVNDSFVDSAPGIPRRLAPRPYIAELPKRLLAGGALASIGHVDRAWGFSFLWPGTGGQPHTIGSTVTRLMQGDRVGYAARYLSSRSTGLAATLLAEINPRNPRERGRPCGADDELIADLYTAWVDARCYTVLGDPAVRLRLKSDDT